MIYFPQHLSPPEWLCHLAERHRVLQTVCCAAHSDATATTSHKIIFLVKKCRIWRDFGWKIKIFVELVLDRSQVFKWSHVFECQFVAVENLFFRKTLTNWQFLARLEQFSKNQLFRKNVFRFSKQSILGICQKTRITTHHFGTRFCETVQKRT